MIVPRGFIKCHPKLGHKISATTTYSRAKMQNVLLKNSLGLKLYNRSSPCTYRHRIILVRKVQYFIGSLLSSIMADS
jgi:hypothetical protein